MMTKMKGRWFMLLFALPFAGVGLGFLLLSIIPSVVEWRQMQSWPQVDAQLYSAELVSSRGDDSTTYRVDAHYSYHFGGRNYDSRRVGIMEGSDNIGDFHQVVAGRLEDALRTGTPVPAWVNPANPADAVLNRDMRWDMLAFKGVFALTFGGVGIGLLAWTLLAKPAHVEHPDAASKPWLTRRAWMDNRIVCSGKGGLWFVWIFALFWNAISAPVLFAMPAEYAKGNHLILIALIVWWFWSARSS